MCLRQTVCLLELGGNECDNLNFMNFRIDSFQIRKTANFRKI